MAKTRTHHHRFTATNHFRDGGRPSLDTTGTAVSVVALHRSSPKSEPGLAEEARREMAPTRLPFFKPWIEQLANCNREPERNE